MKKGVFLCTCSGTIDIDFKKLKKDITADVVEIHNMLCHNDGLARLRESVKTNELGQALVACTSMRQIFDPLGLELEFINIREHCGWVHEKKYATEKARILVNAALGYPQQTGNIIISNIDGIHQEKLLSVSTNGCASGKSGFTGCSLCEVICPSGAITRNGDSIVFNEISCEGCCACASVCPLSHFQLKQDIYPKMEFLLNSSRLSPNILMFGCKHSLPVLEIAGRKKIKYPPILPLFLPCTAGVSEVHILRAFDLGADGVIIMGCRDCLSKSNGATGLAGLILKDLGLDGRISIINSDGTDSFVGSMTAFSKCLVPNPLKVQVVTKMEKSGKRQNMLKLLRSMAAKTGIVPGLVVHDKEYPFAAISIGKKCTVCGACTAMCPTGALNREGGSIQFTYGDCIACGLCEKACPEAAIKTRNVLDLAKLVYGVQETLIQTGMQECSACKRPYMTAAAFDRITGSLILNVRNDLKPQEQVELINNQVELLKLCEQCRPVRAISKLEVFL